MLFDADAVCRAAFCREVAQGAGPRLHDAALCAVLENDPRPSYQHDAGRVYGFVFAGCEVRFTVDGEVLTVRSVGPENGA